MWIKLGNEYLNLEHIVRVRFNKGWKNGVEEWVAEVESFVKGEIQVFARYRNRDADALLAALQNQNIPVEVPVPVPVPVPVSTARDNFTPFPREAATTNTLHDI
jgi:hypothetical protein